MGALTLDRYLFHYTQGATHLGIYMQGKTINNQVGTPHPRGPTQQRIKKYVLARIRQMCVFD